MAVGRAVGPPYFAALQLTGWAIARHDYLEGRLLLAGIDTARLTARQWLSIAYAVMADSIDGLVNRDAVLAKLDEALLRSPWPDRATWGTDPQAVAGQRAMMRLAGGPARMRSPDAKRPTPS